MIDLVRVLLETVTRDQDRHRQRVADDRLRQEITGAHTQSGAEHLRFD